MKIESIKLNNLKEDRKYLLSFPTESSKCSEHLISFPFISFVMIDMEDIIISGFEFIEYFKKQNKSEIEVIRVNKREADTLIIAFNYKEKFFGFNTYEKLIFIQKILYNGFIK